MFTVRSASLSSHSSSVVHSSILIWIQLQNQLMAPLKSCHVWFWLFSERFIYINNIWSPSAGILCNHRVRTGQRYSSILSHHTTVRMTLMAKRHKSLLEFQWKVHTRWEGGLTCSMQDPEQMWSRRPPPGNWLVQGGLPGKREKSHSFRAQRTDNRCAGWRQMVTSSGHTGRKASFSTFRLLIAGRAGNFTAKARFALPDIERQNYIWKGDAI